MEHYIRAIHKPTQVPCEANKSPVKLSSYLSTLSITPPSHLKEAFASYRYERRSIVKPKEASPPRSSSSSTEHKTYNQFYRPSYFPPIRRVNVTQRLEPPPNMKTKREFLIERLNHPIPGSTTVHTSKPWKELMDCEICCEKTFHDDDELSDVNMKIDP